MNFPFQERKREQDLFDINLLKSSYSVNSREFIIYQCNKNMNYYNSAEKGIEKLHNRYKKGLTISKNMGIGILKKIEKNKYNVFENKKNNLNKVEKIKIILKSLNFFDILKLLVNYFLYNFIY